MRHHSHSLIYCVLCVCVCVCVFARVCIYAHTPQYVACIFFSIYTCLSNTHSLSLSLYLSLSLTHTLQTPQSVECSTLETTHLKFQTKKERDLARERDLEREREREMRHRNTQTGTHTRTNTYTHLGSEGGFLSAPQSDQLVNLRPNFSGTDRQRLVLRGTCASHNTLAAPSASIFVLLYQ